ncbi:MAG: C-terminal helicase domain-containing protein, partial [Thermomicrobiales bacterium]
VVVPHRAQKAAIGSVLAGKFSPEEASRAFEAVDTVERFQGGERDAIIVSATESDPVYLLASGGFLYDPNRLTVALSRAKQKLVLIAGGSVFELFSPDAETYQNIELWRSIPRTYCTEPLWSGDIEGVRVEVLGNRTALAD